MSDQPASTTDTAPTDADDADIDDTTTNTQVRWAYLGSAIAVLTSITFVTLLLGSAAGILSLSTIPQGWFVLFASLVTTVFVWLYGTDAYQQWKK